MVAYFTSFLHNIDILSFRLPSLLDTFQKKAAHQCVYSDTIGTADYRVLHSSIQLVVMWRHAVKLGCQGNRMSTSFVSRTLPLHSLPPAHFLLLLGISTSCASKPPLQRDHIRQPYAFLSLVVNCSPTWGHYRGFTAFMTSDAPDQLSV